MQHALKICAADRSRPSAAQAAERGSNQRTGRQSNRFCTFHRLIVLLALLVVGCILPACAQSRPSSPAASSDAEAQTPSAPSAKDPCPEQLHDLCEPLLMYYSINKRLPRTLQQLQSIAGPDPKYVWTCPDSKNPYIYNPAGLYWPDISGRAVLYDAQPSHAGMRWTITVEPAKPGQPLVTRIVAIPNSRFPPNP